MSYKLAIIGSRKFQDWHLMLEKFHELVQEYGYPSQIVSGGADGADYFAEELSMLYQINMKVFPADWERLGKRAGPIRNALIVDYVDMVLAFPGDGTGTQHAISLAERRACPMFVYQV